MDFDEDDYLRSAIEDDMFEEEMSEYMPDDDYIASYFQTNDYGDFVSKNVSQLRDTIFDAEMDCWATDDDIFMQPNFD